MKKAALVTLILGGMIWAEHSMALTISPPRFELAANPGQRAEAMVKLFNETDRELVLYSSSSNFTAAEDEEGVPKFYDLKEGEEDLSKWIEIEKGPITIAPQETKEIPFAINVPGFADPGGHYASIFFGSGLPDGSGGSGVGLSEKIGALILLRVSGDILEEGRLVEFKLKDPKPFYDHLPVGFTLTFENSGNVHLKPQGEVAITNLLGQKSGKADVNKDQISGGKNILPRTSRHFEASWTRGLYQEPGTGFFGKLRAEMDNFALGRYKAVLDLGYGSQSKKEKAEAVFWVFPWHLILVVVLGSAALVAVLVLAVKSYNRWIIKQVMGKMDQKDKSS